MSWKQYKAGQFTKVGSCYYYCLINHPSPPSIALGPFLCRYVSSSGEWRVGFLDFLASCPLSPPLPRKPSAPPGRSPGSLLPLAEGGGRPPFLASLAPDVCTCPDSQPAGPGSWARVSWPSVSGVKGGGGRTAGRLREGGRRRRCAGSPPASAGGGSRASSALAQLLPAVALGPALLAAPAPRLDTRLTHALLSATSFLPATAAAPSLPTAPFCEPRHPSRPVTPLPER